MIKCGKCKDALDHHETLTFVLKDNKYNFIKEDGTELFEESLDFGEDEQETNYKNGDSIDYCLICRNWEL